MLNKKALAVRVGVEQHTVVRWELGQVEPAPENIDSFVAALKYPKEFFFGSDIDEPDGKVTSFRSQTAMTAGERDAALAAGALAFMIYDWVIKRFDLPTPSLPDLGLLEPEAAARTLRQEWCLGEKPVSNMIQLLESKGVGVFSLSENTTHLNAFSLWRRNVPYVFFNMVKSAECSRFDAAHELGHLVLHQDGSVTGREAEDQANRFASAFLMPQADVLASLRQIRSLDKLIAAKSRWRVSLAALNYRVHKLGLTTDWTNRYFCIEIAKRGYYKHEPNGIEREKSVVWEKVIKALWAESMTHLEIAKELSLPPSEVSDFLFGMLHQSDSNKPKSKPQLSVVTELDSQEKATA